MFLLDLFKPAPKARAYMVIYCHIFEGGYHTFVQKTVRASGLRGWMKMVEREMGSYIEVELEGKKPDLERVIAKLRVAPPMAKVSRVALEWREYKGSLGDFRLRN